MNQRTPNRWESFPDTGAMRNERSVTGRKRRPDSSAEYPRAFWM